MPPTQTDMLPTYEAALASLSALIPELFSGPQRDLPTNGLPTRRKFSLDQIRILSAALGNPHRRFKSILIAGTNGKGSTAATLASIARAAGLKTGLYTSPHLADVNERIRVLRPTSAGRAVDSENWEGKSQENIPDQSFAHLYFQVHDTAQELVLRQQLPGLPSYFELLTALAFLYFAEEQVDLAVLEVGMGGRLDATNLVDPILSILTDISLDHQEWLGDTIAEIAREKAGILRPNGTLITLPQHPEANQVIGEVATSLNVRAVAATEFMPHLHQVPDLPYSVEVEGTPVQVDSPLKGSHQHRNISLAIAAAIELAKSHGFSISPAHIQSGIHDTYWPGRLESIDIPDHPRFLLDVAHNPAGAWTLRSALSSRRTFTATESQRVQNSSSGGTCLIFACLRDKPLREMAQILFPIFDHIVLAPIQSHRATELADLKAAAEATGVPSTPAQSVAEAIQIALSLSPVEIIVSGSVYLVGEARTLLLNRQAETIRHEAFHSSENQTSPQHATPQEAGS